MVKMQAVQSALAVRRQRSRREEVRKARQRRQSGASVFSTPRPSIVSIDGTVYFDDKRESKHILGHVTMFHVGGVLILIGLMLVITSLMPSYVNSTTLERRNDLLGTGSFFVILGGVFTTISRFVSNNEEKELNQYIQGRLSRSRSGHRLARYSETGNSTPQKERKNKTSENGVISPQHSATGLQSNNLSENNSPDEEITIEASTTSTTFTEDKNNSGHVVVGVESPIPVSSSTEPVLSRILEEDEIEIDTDATTEPIDSTPESSLTPTSPLETQGLLDKHHSPRSSSKGSVKSSCKSLRVTS
ncbi:UNVERIFIED_CONTAM: hypothetical protein RMT77_006700 [Armadillidium vulgare]